MAIVCDRTSLLRSCSHAWGSVPRRGYMSWSVSQGWLPKITSSVNCGVNCICKSLMLENLHLLLAWSDFSSKGQEQLSWQHRGAGGEGFLTTAVPHRRDAGMFAAGYSAWVLNLTPSSCEGKPPRVSLWVPTALPKGHDGAARTSEREMGTMQPAPGAELQMPTRRTHGKFSIQTWIRVETVALGQLWCQEKLATRSRLKNVSVFLAYKWHQSCYQHAV